MDIHVPLLFLLIFVSNNSAQLQCYVPGEVVGGTFIGYSTAATYNECRAFCRADSECQFFTFFGDQPQAGCLTYSSCDTIEPLCTKCFSGERDCPVAQPVCGESGFCDGTSIDAPPADTESACQKACYDTENCQWYSFLPSLGRCFLSSDCIKVEECTDGCTHGEKDCYLYQEQGLQKLVTIGGYSGSNYVHDVDIIDLSGKNETCNFLPPFSIRVFGAVGIYLDEKIIVCGGYFASGHTKYCYFLQKGAEAWTQTISLSEPRFAAAAVQLSPSEWWIAGGRASGSSLLASSEIVMGDLSSTNDYVTLPRSLENHNLVKINSSCFALVGTGVATDDVWIFDKETEEWSYLAEMPRRAPLYHAGLVQYSNGTKQLVIAAGKDDCFGLDLATLEWTDLPAIGVPTDYGEVVPYGDTFLVLGGQTSVRGTFQFSDEIFKFDPFQEDWVSLPQRLKIPSRSTTGVLVPDDFLECS